MWLNLAQVPCGVAVNLFYLEIHVLLSSISQMEKSVLRLIALLMYMVSFLRFFHKFYHHHSCNFITFICTHTSIHVALNFKNMYYYDQSVH